MQAAEAHADRLKSVFREKIHEFREVVCLLFGYRIDMVDKKYTLRPRSGGTRADRHLTFTVRARARRASRNYARAMPRATRRTTEGAALNCAACCGLRVARACAQQDGEGNLNMLESEWASALSTLIREFLQEGGSIPAFLSAATLQLFRDAQAAGGTPAFQRTPR